MRCSNCDFYNRLTLTCIQHKQNPQTVDATMVLIQAEGWDVLCSYNIAITVLTKKRNDRIRHENHAKLLAREANAIVWITVYPQSTLWPLPEGSTDDETTTFAMTDCGDY